MASAPADDQIDSVEVALALGALAEEHALGGPSAMNDIMMTTVKLLGVTDALQLVDPHDFGIVCPPVVPEVGHDYEHAEIEEWFATCQRNGNVAYDHRFGAACVKTMASAPADDQIDSVEVALALGALAEEHALGGLAMNDIMMTTVKLLAFCSNCGAGPAVESLAFDRDKSWFNVSGSFCYPCFVEGAIRLHGDACDMADEYRARGDDAGSTHSSHDTEGQATDTGDDSDDSSEPEEEEDAFARINRLLQGGGIRALQIGSGACDVALEGHTEEVFGVAYSPDGATIATVSDDRTLRLWDSKSGRCRRVLEGHNRRIEAVGYSPDGTSIVTGSFDNTVRLWDAGSGECERALEGHTDSATGVAFSPDGMTVATGSKDRTVRLWDVVSGQCQRILRGHTNGVNAIAFSPVGATIATGSDDKTVRLWNAVSGECLQLLQGHAQPVMAVAYSPDGATLATGSLDGTVRLWDAKSGRCQRVLPSHASGVLALAFSPDGATLATSSGGGYGQPFVRLWDVASGECRRAQRSDSHWINAVAFSPDGATLAAGGHHNDVRLWRTNCPRSPHPANDAAEGVSSPHWASRVCTAVPQRHAAQATPASTDEEARRGLQAAGTGITLVEGMDVDIVVTRVAEFYAVHSPDVAGGVVARIVRNYNGQYSLLADALNFKYLGQLPKSSDLLPSSPGFVAQVGGLVLYEDTMLSEHVAHQLRVFLERHDPPRVDDVPRLMKLYAGRYRALFDSINAATLDLPRVEASTTVAADHHPKPPQWPDLDIDDSRKELLGKGAFGEVYRVYSRALETDVAMKCVAPQQDCAQAEREADRMRQVADCGHVVRVLSFQRQRLYAVIYMELMAGGSLEDLVRREGPQWEERCRAWIRDALVALKRLHCVDIIHRDVKPSNMLLDAADGGIVKLGDLGLTKDLDETVHSVGDAKGTWQYIAPELLATVPDEHDGGLSYGSACDVWSLGCTWVRLLTGQRPWDGVFEVGSALFHPVQLAAQLLINPTLVPRIPPWLSPEARGLLGRMLQRDPRERIVVEGLLHSGYFTRPEPAEGCETYEEFVARRRDEMGAGAAAADGGTHDEEADGTPSYIYDVSSCSSASR